METMDTNLEKSGSESVVEAALKERFALDTSRLPLAETVGYLCDKIAGIPAAGVRVVSLVGGAGAGKSTLAAALVAELQARSITADRISTDGFVIGTREERRELEKKDALAKYDFDYLNQIVRRVRAGENNIAAPTYDEATGLAIAIGEENYSHHVGSVQCLIVEGDFDKVENPDLRVYLHVSDETRLRNRIQRDLVQRGETDHRKITGNFQLRQAQQHIPHTLPALEKADIVVSATPGETGYAFDAYSAKR